MGGDTSDRAVDQTQLLKGVLDLAVLAVLAHEDSYGYEVVRRLHDAALSDIAEASVYGTLRRLFRGGLLTSYLVASDAGPHRKYYGLTPTGRQHLKLACEEWVQFSSAMSGLVSGLERGRDDGDDHPRPVRAELLERGGGGAGRPDTRRAR